MINEIEQLMEEIVKAVKSNGDLSAWKKNRKLSPFINLASNLNSIPKSKVPQFDFMRVRSQILEKISQRAEVTQKSLWPKFLGIGASVIGSFLIVTSLTLATAVAALQSVPGQTIYPLKKVVENMQLRFASDEERVALQLQFAQNRAEEIRAVLDRQEEGKLTTEQAQQIVSETIHDLQKTAAAAANATAKQPKVTIVNRLTALTNSLKAASVRTEGDVKIEIEKALVSTKISQEEAIKNIENAGIKVDEKPISIDNGITASGKLTAVSSTTLSIGTAKFSLTKDTVYEGIKAGELAVGQLVDITGEITDNKTIALKVILVSEPKPEVPQEETTETPEPVEEQ